MAAHLPPVPPANRSDKGPGEPPEAEKNGVRDSARPDEAPANAQEQGRSGNIAQNTRNEGHQQDR